MCVLTYPQNDWCYSRISLSQYVPTGDGGLADFNNKNPVFNVEYSHC